MVKIAYLESRGEDQPYTNKNQSGFVGKYQQGVPSLMDTGYIKHDTSNKGNDWKSAVFTGKNGIRNLDDFLNNPAVQEQQAREYKTVQWRQLKAKGADKLIGTYYAPGGDQPEYKPKKNDVKITLSGLLGGAHLLGSGGIIQGIKSVQAGGQDREDGNKTKGVKYVEALNGFDIGPEIGVSLASPAPTTPTPAPRQSSTDAQWISREPVSFGGHTIPESTAITPTFKNGTLFSVAYDGENGPISLSVAPSAASIESRAMNQTKSPYGGVQQPSLSRSM